MLRLSKIETSSNPLTKKTTVNGREFSVMKDGRLFLIAFLVSMTNPFASFKRRLIAQSFNSQGQPVWNFDLDAFFVGMQINGEIVNKDVLPYNIKSFNSKTGEEEIRIATQYSTVVLEGEKLETIFHNQGHRLCVGKDATTGQPMYETIDVLPPRFRTAPSVAITEDEEATIASMTETITN